MFHYSQWSNARNSDLKCGCNKPLVVRMRTDVQHAIEWFPCIYKTGVSGQFEQPMAKLQIMRVCIMGKGNHSGSENFGAPTSQ